MPRVLLIDDDEALAPPLAAYLERFDLTLEAAARPSAGLARLARGGIDAAILDVMLPEMDGFELCRRIRADPALAALPILMLTARGELSDKVVGLELGADDYLPKPFEPRELAARLATILRRARPVAANVAPELHFDGLSIDAQRREVLRQGRPVELTGTEFELLLLLAREPQRVWSRDEILNRLRGHDALDLHTRAVDILVSRLRRKLEPLDCIKTLRNAGYRFAAGAPA
ncbi:MAG: response regulator transcription factor [Proteobacteria bacterium]|nr:response regulator transcription factor [Pseudomonadota bacterium]